MAAMRALALFTLAFLFSGAAAAAKPHSQPSRIYSQITVMGLVYCDICSNNSFSKHSYFLPGADVRVDCTFKAATRRTSEEIFFSVNRTTNRYGVYKLDIPSVDGIRCAEDAAIMSSCRSTLMWSPSSSCNVPGYRATSDEISVKSRQENVCIYSLNPLNYRPFKREEALCGRN